MQTLTATVPVWCVREHARQAGRLFQLQESYRSEPVMRLVILAILAGSGFAQGSFYGTGLSVLPQSSPKPTGWAAAIVPINTAQRVYSISEFDFSIVRVNGASSIQTSARTGIATWLRAFGPVNVYALADAGASTTGANSSGALAGGGIVTFPTRWPALYGAVGVRLLKTAVGTETLVETGFIFGKGK